MIKMRHKLRVHVVALYILILFVRMNIICCKQSNNLANFFKMRDHFIVDAPGEKGFLIEKKRSIPCDSCGNECASACGTKNFRTCCFNYLRKRNDPSAMHSIADKRLIDFILLQGHAMYTLSEHKQKRNGRSDLLDIF